MAFGEASWAEKSEVEAGVVAETDCASTTGDGELACTGILASEGVRASVKACGYGCVDKTYTAKPCCCKYYCK